MLLAGTLAAQAAGLAAEEPQTCVLADNYMNTLPVQIAADGARGAAIPQNQDTTQHEAVL